MFTLLRLVLSALVASSLAYSTVGQSNIPSVADWRSDIDQIVNDIRLLHPDPFTKTGKLTFLREVERLKAEVPSFTEEQRVVRAMKLVTLIGDGHTQLEPDNPSFAVLRCCSIQKNSRLLWDHGSKSETTDLGAALQSAEPRRGRRSFFQYQAESSNQWLAGTA